VKLIKAVAIYAAALACFVVPVLIAVNLVGFSR
jgi:hypothetical protein